MIIEDEYLQHFGVKGMKWGVRRNRDSDESNPYKKRLSRGQKVAVASTIIGGGLALAILHNTKGVRVDTLMRAPTAAIDDFVKTTMRRSGSTPVMPKAPAGKMSPRTVKDLENFAQWRQQMAKTINAEMKKHDNDFGIPFPDRWYMPET